MAPSKPAVELISMKASFRFFSLIISEYFRFSFLAGALMLACVIAGCGYQQTNSGTRMLSPGPTSSRVPLIASKSLSTATAPAAQSSGTTDPLQFLSPKVKLLATVPISVSRVFGPGQEFHPLDWSPNGTELAYTWQDGVWGIQAPAFRSMQLIGIPQGNMGQVYWSPHAKHLAFRGMQQLESEGFEGEFIWIVQSDGTQLKKITSQAIDPLRAKFINQWLDDQTLTFNLWRGSGTRTLYKVDTATASPTALIEILEPPQEQAVGGEYYWAPGNKYIAIQNGYGILVVNSNALDNRKWLSEPFSPPIYRFQAWMPDGHRFLYTRQEQDEPSRSSLWIWDVDTWQGKKLLEQTVVAVPSPDGSKLAFLHPEKGTWQPPNWGKELISRDNARSKLTLGILDLASGAIQMKGSSGYKVEDAPDHPEYWRSAAPVWSPDGKTLSYWGEDGNVWSFSTDQQLPQRLTQGVGIAQILWSPDASKLALRTLNKAWIIERPSE